MIRRLAAGVALASLVTVGGAHAQQPAATTCGPGDPAVVVEGSATEDDVGTYRMLPVEVAAGTTRIEVGYEWSDQEPAAPSTPLTQSVVDLGLWDADGQGTVAGFRGWSGSRQGRTAAGQEPVFVQADTAERGYTPGPIEPGTWWVELGIAAVGPSGLRYAATVTCLDPPVGAPPAHDPVDPDHVADPDRDWYAGDFHMHGFHSSPAGPGWDELVGHARSAGLDFLPITEYVTNRHHGELGAVQRAHPDLVIWPSREVITYAGHATVFGETPSVAEHRHGHEGITLGAIQAASVADGALFGVAHPTIFPGPLFANFCRGCEFRLGDDIDWSEVHTMEVLTGPILVDDSELGGPGVPVQIQNPFVESAIDLWESRLLAGDRITAVSGSDDKAGPDLGSSATLVLADELSRPALVEAIRGGRAYVQTKGVGASPTLEVVAQTPDGATGGIGDVLATDRADIEVTVTGASGQVLRITRDGDVVGVVPITADPFTHVIEATTAPGSGPLGTFWRVDTADTQSLTTIANPVFLAPRTVGPAPSGPQDPAAPDRAGGPRRPPGAGGVIAATGGGGLGAAPVVLGALGIGLLVLLRSRMR